MKKIFLIEDDVNLLYGLQAKFRVAEYEVMADESNGGVEAVIENIKKYKPDFIILDLILPAIDGFILLEKIKTQSEISRIPVFIFSNLSDSDSRLKSESLGASHYFLKSDFNLDSFVDKIHRLITNWQ